MFLLVPAHPGFPGQIPQSRKTVVLCCVCVCVCVSAVVTDLSHILFVGLLAEQSIQKVYCGKTADWIRMPFGVRSVEGWVY